MNKVLKFFFNFLLIVSVYNLFLKGIFAMRPPVHVAEGFVRVKGTEIVDEKGQPLIIRGVGLGNWLLPEGYMWKLSCDRPRRIEKLILDLVGPDRAFEFWQIFRRDFIREEDIKRISELGFNCVRPALNARLFMEETEPFRIRNEGFELLDRLIELCKKYKLYVVIDLHGAIGGQTGGNIDDSIDDKPELFMNNKFRSATLRLLNQIALRYKDNPTVIAYDILNEPLPGNWSHLFSELESFYKEATSVIRSVDQNHMITLEGANWATDFSIFRSVFDPNTFYQFHKYWSPCTKETIQQYLDFRKKWNVPLWIGESGENSNDWYWCNFQLYEDMNIGWSFWPWKKLDSASGCVSIKLPQGWQKLEDYCLGKNNPDPEEIWQVLKQYLENIRLENCIENTEVIRSIFRRVPGKVQAEHFGFRGKGISYYTKKIILSVPSSPRKEEPVDIKLLKVNYGVGWIEKGEWLKYKTLCKKSAIYDVYLSMASIYDDKIFSLEVNNKDISGPVKVPNTGDWKRFTNVVLKNIKFQKGEIQIVFHSLTGGYNLDRITIVPAGEEFIEDKYNQKEIPGTIESEDYVDFWDVDTSNQGGEYRDDGVDIETLSKDFVLRLTKDDWFSYEINCEKEGLFLFYPKIVTKDSITLQIEINGKKEEELKYPAKITAQIPLVKGKNIIKLICVEGKGDLDWFEIK